MACCINIGVVGCAKPVPSHFVEKIGPSELNILSLVNGEKNF